MSATMIFEDLFGSGKVRGAGDGAGAASDGPLSLAHTLAEEEEGRRRCVWLWGRSTEVWTLKKIEEGRLWGRSHKYSQAINLYTQAIEVYNENAVYWANHSFTHTKLEEYGSAVEDASRAVEIDPDYSKAGYYRRGAAYLAMGMFKEALEDFQQVKKIHPNDPDAPNKLKECEKVVLKLRFEEAIALPDSQRHSITNSIKFCSTGVKGDAILPTRGKMCDTCKGEKITKHEHLLTSTSPADGVANVVGRVFRGIFEMPAAAPQLHGYLPAIRLGP
ncbi:hypothetical protein LguiB_012657 [Lonicera macranthoides]